MTSSGWRWRGEFDKEKKCGGSGFLVREKTRLEGALKVTHEKGRPVLERIGKARSKKGR